MSSQDQQNTGNKEESLTIITSNDIFARLTNSNPSTFDQNDQDQETIEHWNLQMIVENEERVPATPEEIMDILRNLISRDQRGETIKNLLRTSINLHITTSDPV